MRENEEKVIFERVRFCVSYSHSKNFWCPDKRRVTRVVQSLGRLPRSGGMGGPTWWRGPRLFHRTTHLGLTMGVGGPKSEWDLRGPLTSLYGSTDHPLPKSFILLTSVFDLFVKPMSQGRPRRSLRPNRGRLSLFRPQSDFTEQTVLSIPLSVLDAKWSVPCLNSVL